MSSCILDITSYIHQWLFSQKNFSQNTEWFLTGAKGSPSCVDGEFLLLYFLSRRRNRLYLG